jgi:FkbH-like protein
MYSTLRGLLDEMGERPMLSRIRASRPEIDRLSAHLPPVRIAISATYTVDMLQPYLTWALAARGLHLKWTPVPYDQIYPQLIEPTSDLRRGGTDIAVLLMRIEELFASSWAQLPGDVTGARATAGRELDSITSAISGFIHGFNGLLMAGNFVCPQPLPLGLNDAASMAGGTAFCEWLNAEWRSRLAQFATVRIIDVAGALAARGGMATSDPTRWYLGKIPFKETGFEAIAMLIARSVASWLLPAKKVIVADCDGTMWGGVVGEDGPTGILLGDTPPGNAYADFQRHLLRLRDRGFVLTLCSKNDEGGVWEVFEKNEAMVLRREDIVAARINWETKSANLREIARDLNVGVESLVLFDDSPAECAEVRANLPEAAVVELPEDAARFVETVEASGLFDRLSVTAEDRNRQQYYAQESQRKEMQRNIAPGEYLRSLAIETEIFQPRDADLPRITQLINKTNQFNLTTRRRTEGDVISLASDARVRIYGVRVRDRFGDYGLTGAAIVGWESNCAKIDTFLLSCRVLGRRVEDALLGRIVADCAAGGIVELRARFTPTAKNAPASRFLDENGFGVADGDGWQSLVVMKPREEAVNHVSS